MPAYRLVGYFDPEEFSAHLQQGAGRSMIRNTLLILLVALVAASAGYFLARAMSPARAHAIQHQPARGGRFGGTPH